MKIFKKTALCIMLGLLALLICSCKEQSKDVAPNPLEKEGYTLVFNDEFDGEEIDIDKWLPQYLPHATSSAAGCLPTYEMKDGILHLMITEDTPFYNEGSPMKVSSIQTLEKNQLHPGAGGQFTNVMPYESFATQYGYFEIRCKLPDCGGGGAAAWWMCGAQDDARADGSMSTQTGEIDIIEMLLEYPNVFDPKVHAWTDEALYEWREQVAMEGTYDDSFHIFAMDWTPEGLTFYVDGKELTHTDQSPEYRMCMFLGIYATYEEQWSGMPNDVYPKDFQIDYIRVYKDNNGYPNGYTRPSDPVVLPEDSAVQLKAKWADLVADEDINNLALTATVTTTAEDSLGRDTGGLFDGDYTTDFTSTDDPTLPHEFLFTWAEPQSFKTFRVGSFYGAGQAPTYMEVLTKTADGEWESRALVNVSWLDNGGKGEYVDIEVNAENVTELKLLVNNANLEWNHYCITELQVLGEVPEGSASTKYTAQNADESITNGTQENLAASASMSTTAVDAEGRDGSRLFDGDFKTDFTSTDAPTLPHEFVLKWNSAVSFKTVRIGAMYGAGQGITNVELFVKDSSGEWVSISNAKITWKGNSDVPEYVDIPVEATNVRQFKLVINGAKLDWNHYAFTELQLLAE